MAIYPLFPGIHTRELTIMPYESATNNQNSTFLTKITPKNPKNHDILKMGVRGVNAGLEKSSIFDNVTGRVKRVLAGVFVVGLAPPLIYTAPILGVF